MEIFETKDGTIININQITMIGKTSYANEYTVHLSDGHKFILNAYEHNRLLHKISGVY